MSRVCVERGVVGAVEVGRLRGEVLGGGRIDRGTAESLFRINDAVCGAENDPGWSKLFCEAVGRHLLEDAHLPGVLDEGKVGWLIQAVGADGKIDRTELDLLVYLCVRARGAPPRFHQFVFTALKEAILADGVIDEEEVGMIRRVIFGLGGVGGQRVTRSEGDFLFDLNDATAGAENHPWWKQLFVEALTRHLLEDTQSPGQVDAAEAEHILRRIEADRQFDENERALMDHIRHHIDFNQIWGGIRSDDLLATTSLVRASLFARACDGGRGGDIYYFGVSASDLITSIAVADVAGHGETVSQISQWVYEALAARLNTADSHEVLAELNRLAAERGFKAMTTAAVVSLFRTDSNLHYACAGHPPMYLRRKAEGRWQTVKLPEHEGPANLPLGVLAEAPYDEQQTPLVSGDRMFLYTDGLVEAPDSKDEQFGMERLAAVLGEAGGQEIKGLKDAVLEALRRHTGGRLDHDDVTFMAVEVL